MTIEAIPSDAFVPAPAREVSPAPSYRSSQLWMDGGVQLRPDHWHGRLIGEIDLHTRQCLSDLIRRIGCTGALVHLDLSQVTFMDASGVGLLVALRNHLVQTGGELILVNLTARTVRLLQISGADALAVAPAG